jgi:hypothetical protein
MRSEFRQPVETCFAAVLRLQDLFSGLKYHICFTSVQEQGICRLPLTKKPQLPVY